ncbi:hypothetical protein V8F33_001663 [Rhypophila sp. PSN 637]
MTILPSLIAQAMGRSPYDDEVWHLSGHPTPGEHSQRYQQQYDQRGRPVNPDTRRLNRDIIRAHNEVMLAIGVAEPEISEKEQEAKQNSIKRHRQAETMIARRLLFVNGLVEKALVWLVNGMRQQIMVYKDYASLGSPQLLQATGRSWRYYLVAGLPSYVVSDLYEYLWSDLYEYFWTDLYEYLRCLAPGIMNRLGNITPHSEMLYTTAFDHVLSYLRLHLEIFSFLQRVGLSPTDTFLPTWRFFLPGTSISPLPVPPLPTSLNPSSVAGWIGTFALGLAPFAGFYLFKRYSIAFTDILKFKYHSVIPAPRPRNPKRSRAPLGDVTSQYYPDGSDLEPEDATIFPHGNGGADLGGGPNEVAAFPVGTIGPRRQSTASITSRPRGSREDEFASDDEAENEEWRRAVITVELAPAESTTNLPGGNNDLAEIRPQTEENGNTQPYEPVYRVSKFTLLPSYFAASILGLSTFRLISTPWEAFTLSSIARLYATRGAEGTVVGFGGLVMNGLSWRGIFTPWQRWESTLGLEGFLFNGLSFAALGLTWILKKSKVSEEEWEEREKREREAEEEARIPEASQEEHGLGEGQSLQDPQQQRP